MIQEIDIQGLGLNNSKGEGDKMVQSENNQNNEGMTNKPREEVTKS